MMMVPFLIVYGKFKVDIDVFYYYCSLLFQEKTHRDAELQFRDWAVGVQRRGKPPRAGEAEDD